MEIKKIDKKERLKWEKKLGKILRVSRKDYKIFYCGGIRINDRDYAGLCVPAKSEIYINVLLGDVESTLLHEFCHAEVTEGGLRQTPYWSMEIEEILAEIMAEGITKNFQISKLKS